MDKKLIKEALIEMLKEGEILFDIEGEGSVEYDYGNSSSYLSLNLNVMIDGEVIQSCGTSITLS